MSEVLYLYDKIIDVSYYVEVFFHDSPEPDCSVNPILGPEIIKKHLEDERKRLDCTGYHDYLIPIKLMDAAGKGHANVSGMNILEEKNITTWKIIFFFDFIDDVDDFMVTATRNLEDLAGNVEASFLINLSIEDDDLSVQEAEALITTNNLSELSNKFNEVAFKETNKEKENMFYLLDFIFSEVEKQKGELVEYLRVPIDNGFNSKLLLILAFAKFEQFRLFVGELKGEMNHKVDAPLS